MNQTMTHCWCWDSETSLSFGLLIVKEWLMAYAMACLHMGDQRLRVSEYSVEELLELLEPLAGYCQKDGVV